MERDAIRNQLQSGNEAAQYGTSQPGYDYGYLRQRLAKLQSRLYALTSPDVRLNVRRAAFAAALAEQRSGGFGRFGGVQVARGAPNNVRSSVPARASESPSQGSTASVILPSASGNAGNLRKEWNGQSWRDDPFRNLPFDQAAFQEGVDTGNPVRTRSGGSMPFGAAVAIVSRRTGVASFLASSANVDRGRRSDTAGEEQEVGNSNRLRAENHYIGRALDAMRAGDPNAARVAIQLGVSGAGIKRLYRGAGEAANVLTGGGVSAALANARTKGGQPLSQTQRQEIMGVFGQASINAASMGLSAGASTAVQGVSKALDAADLALSAGKIGTVVADPTRSEQERRGAMASLIFMGLLSSPATVSHLVSLGADAKPALQRTVQGIAQAKDRAAAVRAATGNLKMGRAESEQVVQAVDAYLPLKSAHGRRTEQTVNKAVPESRPVLQADGGVLVPEVREGDATTIYSGAFHPDVSLKPIPAIRELVRRALANPKYSRGLVIDHVDKAWQDRVFKDTQVRLENTDVVLTANEVRHTAKRHSDAKIEESRGQIPMKPGQWTQALRVIRDYDKAIAGDKPGTVIFSKVIGKERIVVVLEGGKAKNKLFLKSTYTKAYPKPEVPTAEAKDVTSETPIGTSKDVTP